MGQLERYGLYVLCLVIFLILGVTIWGGEDVPPLRRTAATGLDASAPPIVRTAGDAAGTTTVPDLAALLQPVEPPPAAPRSGGAASERGAGIGSTLNAGAGAELAVLDENARKVADPATTTDVAPLEASASRAPAPTPAATSTYKVKAGDTFDSIAKRQLGDASLRTEIARLNPRVKPERMQIGTVLTLPAVATSSRDAATAKGAVASAGVAAYTVARGDTLEGIARRQLGDRRRVDELRRLNPDVDPTRLRIGQKLRVPKQ